MERWCDLLSEKIDKSKIASAYQESTQADRAIFSSESSEDDEDKISKGSHRKSQNKSQEPAPPNGTVTLEEFFPPIFQFQTNPMPASSSASGSFFFCFLLLSWLIGAMFKILPLSHSRVPFRHLARPILDADSVFELDLEA